jgi:urease accessory protein
MRLKLSPSSLLAASLPSLAAAALAALPLVAAAHVGADGGVAHGHDTGFAQGCMHPFTGLDHLAAMVAVGLWSALAARDARDLPWAPIGFAAMLAAGALLGMAGIAVPAVEPMISASLLVIGLLLAARLRLPGPAAAALVGAFAVFHGVAHGVELSGDLGAVAAVTGMVAATALLHAAGLAAGWALRGRGAWLARIAGGAVAVLGLGLLAQVA